MALNVFELFGKIAIDSSGAEKGLDKTLRHAKDTESKLGSTLKKIGAAAAAAFSVRAIVDFGKQCTQAYANIAAEESAFTQIMGDYSDTARDKLNAVADQTGVSATRMTGAMTSLTAKFKGLGYGVEDATTLASDGLLIAADAAAFWDMSLDESMSHLNSFINGSYEGGEAIGLFANDTQMAAYAIEQGIVKDAKAWSQLDEATKQATRLDYAKKMMQNSGAVGQAAKESKQYANVMANLKESWRQFQGVIGKPLLEKLVLPAMQKLLKMMPGLTEAVQVGIDALSAGFDKVASYFSEVFTEDGLNMDALPDAFSNMFRDLGGAIPGMLRSVGRVIKGAWSNAVWPVIQGVAAKIGIELPGWSEIETKVKTWWENGGFAASIADVCNWTLKLFGAPANVTAEDVSSTLSAWWTNAKIFVQDACVWALKLFNNPKETAEEITAHTQVWWNKVVSYVQDACKWTLMPFSPPEEKGEKAASRLETWWTAAKPFVQAACEWTLDVFKNPPDVTAEEVEAIMDSWWATTKGYVQSACDWVLKTFSPPAEETAEGVSSNMSSWWTKTQKYVQDACTWTLNLFGVPTEEPVDVIACVKGWWDSIRAAVEGVCTWTLKMFNKPKETSSDVETEVSGWWNGLDKTNLNNIIKLGTGFDFPGLEDAKKAVQEWWDGIKDKIKISLSSVFPKLFGGEDEEEPTLDNWKPKESSFSLPETTGGTDAGTGGWTPPGRDLWRTPGVNFGTPGSNNTLPGVIATSVQTALASLPNEIKAAAASGVSEGVGNITITGSVTTGNVMLDGSAIVGRLTPALNLSLGGKMTRNSMSVR